MVSVGIVGLPNVGKSTLFKVLTQKPVEIANYPFCTVEPNKGIVEVPDKRLEQLVKMSNSLRQVPTVIEFVDIAGLVKGANQGEGLGNQFLAQIRETDLILEVVRNFSKDEIIHINNQINPKDDIETVNLELILKDLETVEKYLGKVRRDSKANKAFAQQLAILEKIADWLKEGNLSRDLLSAIKSIKEKEIIESIFKNLQLLTAKPIIYLLNNDLGKEIDDFFYQPAISLDVKLELDSLTLSSSEREELEIPPSKLDALISLCYATLNQITFYTTGEKESRAWTIKKGETAEIAAGKIHSDFQKKFICAEVIDYQTLLQIGSWKKAKESGLIRFEGRDYLVKDGDVIIFKV